MKRLHLLLLTLTVAWITTTTATNVGGTIAANTTWTAANNPYIVTSNISVSSGFTLTIQSGVEVKFNDGFGMTVLGTLTATGATFTSSSASPTAGKWTNITVGSTTTRGIVSLVSCQLYYGQQLTITRGALTTNGTDISNFQNYGIYINGFFAHNDSADVNLTGGTFNSTGNACVYMNANGKLVTNGTSFSAAQYGIATSTNTMGTSSVTGGTISGMTVAAVGVNAPTPFSLSNVTMNGSCVRGLYLNNAIITLTGCTITSCTTPIEYTATSSLILSGVGNSFSGNTNSFVNMNFAGMASSMTLPAIGLFYYFPQTYTVSAGKTLTVPNGSICKFADNISFTVLGTLNATGTSFTSSSASPTAGKWAVFTIGSATDSGLVSLTNCQLAYAQYLQISKGYLGTTNTDFSNFLSAGIYIYGAASNSAFANLVGGSFTNCANCFQLGQNGKIITNGTNLSNSAMGIWFGSSYNGASSFTGGTISNMSTYGIQTLSSSLQSFTNITVNGASTGVYLNNGNLTMTGCTVTSTTIPVEYASPSTLVLNGTANNFSGNTNKYVYMNHGSLTGYNMVLPTISIPYYFHHGYTIYAGGRLQLSDGNILKFPGAGINVHQGKLIASASVGSQIYFTSFKDDNIGGDANGDASATAPAMNQWTGIDFPDATIDSACILRRVTVKFTDLGVAIDNASPTLDSCTFSNNYHGVYAVNASYPIINGCVFGSSGLTPIAQTFDADPVFTGNSFSFQDNQYDAIGLIGSSIVANANLKIRSVTSSPNVTYLMLGDILIPAGKSLTINKGVVIKSPASSYYKINVQGALYANGTNDSNIVMTSARDDNAGSPGDTNKDGTLSSPAKGDFGGIVFAPGSVGGSTVNYCDIRFAAMGGSNTYYANEYQGGGAITMVNASPTIFNCKISNCNIGVMSYQASNPILTNNQIINSSSTPFAVSMSANPTFSNNTFTNAGLLGLGIIGGNVTSNGLLRKRNISGYTNITYVLLDDITIADGTNIEVENGVVIKMIDARAITVNGGFKISGFPSSRVIITSIRDDNSGNPFDTNGDGNATSPGAGNWNLIHFNTTSNDAYCAIRCADIKYGGYYYGDNAAVHWTNASASMDDCLITNTNGYGLRFNGASTPVIDSVVIQNGNYDPIAMSLLADPTFTNITFTANASRGIRILEGPLSSNAYLRKRSMAGISNIAYRIYSLDIASNATLTIEPGVVIKFESWAMNVSGGLIAEGTQAQKIIFTSVHDDSDGGDYNNNGNATGPNKNNWNGIRFYNSALPSSVKNCVFRYGGGNYSYEGVISFNSVANNVVIDSSLIEQSNSPAFGVFGSAAPVLKNLQLLNISNVPVHMAMFSNPTFTNISLANVTAIALGIIPETYSQTATIPKRNFAGYTNITYYGLGTYTVNAGTTITIPEGIVYKGGSWIVNGKLMVLGKVNNPVVFTSPYDDSYGSPADTYLDGNASNPYNAVSGTGFAFSDISNDSSTVRNMIMKYYTTGMVLNSASPTIDSNTFNKCQDAIYLEGTSAPAINNNIFHDLGYMQGYPNGVPGATLRISVLNYPSSTLNNTISGTTLRALYVKDETLSQDVTILKRNFAGISNIPYFFTGFTVGTGAVLTISPGVVCKFRGGVLNVFKGLIAEGGASPDSQIVFTVEGDNFYGGITDPNEINYYRGTSWSGIYFDNQSIDVSCRLKNVVIKNATYGVSMTSASPTITNCLFRENNRGIRLTGASSPVVNYCDFLSNSVGIENVDKSFTINAENCWWGNNTGPTHTGNVGGTGDAVTDAVDYTPFRTIDAQNPVMGDVSLNGYVQAYDAAMVLQKAVSLITFNTLQNRVGDVSASAGVTAFDASLILQYIVGQIRTFPAEELFKTRPVFPATASLELENATAEAGSEITIQIHIQNVTGMMSFDLQLNYDKLLFDFVSIGNGAYLEGLSVTQNIETATGRIYLSVANINQMGADGALFYLTLKVKETAPTISTKVSVSTFLANEDDMLEQVSGGTLNIVGHTPTGLQNIGLLKVEKAYPNPFADDVIIPFYTSQDGLRVQMTVFSIYGEKVFESELSESVSGLNKVSWNGKDVSQTDLPSGSYFISISAGQERMMQKVSLIK